MFFNTIYIKLFLRRIWTMAAAFLLALFCPAEAPPRDQKLGDFYFISHRAQAVFRSIDAMPAYPNYNFYEVLRLLIHSMKHHECYKFAPYLKTLLRVPNSFVNPVDCAFLIDVLGYIAGYIAHWRRTSPDVIVPASLHTEMHDLLWWHKYARVLLSKFDNIQRNSMFPTYLVKTCDCLTRCLYIMTQIKAAQWYTATPIFIFF